MGNIFRKKQCSVNNFEINDNYEEIINNYFNSITEPRRPQNFIITDNFSNDTPPPLPYDYASGILRKLT